MRSDTHVLCPMPYASYPMPALYLCLSSAYAYALFPYPMPILYAPYLRSFLALCCMLFVYARCTFELQYIFPTPFSSLHDQSSNSGSLQ
jgi:hypothetical protein